MLTAFLKPEGSAPAVKILHHTAICIARKRIWIQNPYFIPEPEAIDAFGEAVKRGVDVRVMMPAADVIDSPIVQHASHHHFGDLLANGVRVFEYTKTLLHQKVMIVDGKWSCVGSTNFDDRSFLLNDEVSVGFTNARIAQELRDAWFDDLRHCTEVQFEEWRARPWPHKLLDGVGFLMRREF